MTNHSDFSPEQEGIEASSSPSQPILNSKPAWWIVATLATVIVAVVFLSVMHYQANAQLIAQLEDTN
jgi:hypothetical protein